MQPPMMYVSARSLFAAINQRNEARACTGEFGKEVRKATAASVSSRSGDARISGDCRRVLIGVRHKTRFDRVPFHFGCNVNRSGTTRCRNTHRPISQDDGIGRTDRTADASARSHKKADANTDFAAHCGTVASGREREPEAENRNRCRPLCRRSRVFRNRNERLHQRRVRRDGCLADIAHSRERRWSEYGSDTPLSNIRSRSLLRRRLVGSVDSIIQTVASA